MIVIIFDKRDGNAFTSLFPVRMAELSQTQLTYKFNPYSTIWTTLKQSDRMVFKTWDDIEFNHNDKYFYYINCTSANDIGLTYPLEFLSPEKLQAIADYNVNVWYDFSYEYHHVGFWIPAKFSDQNWRTMFRKVNPNYTGRIILSILNADSLVNEKPEVAVNLIDLPHWLHMTRLEFGKYLDYSELNDELYLYGDKKYLFLNLNREGHRKNRTMFIHGLKSRNLINSGIVTLIAPAPLTIADLIFLGIEDFDDDLRKRLISSVVENPLLPIMKWSTDSVGELGYNWSYCKEWLENVCFDVVSETIDNLGPNQVSMITEKTIKTLLLGKPFIINSNAGALKKLRHYGFRTFPYLFDESYDDEPNYNCKLHTLLDNIERWKHKENEFMNIVRDNYQDIIFNKQRILSFPLEDYVADQLERY